MKWGRNLNYSVAPLSCQASLLLLNSACYFSLTADIKRHRYDHLSHSAHIPLPCNNILPNASEVFQVVLIQPDVFVHLLIRLPCDCLQTAQPTNVIGSSMLMACVSSLHVWCWRNKLKWQMRARLCGRMKCSSLCCSQSSWGVLLWFTKEKFYFTQGWQFFMLFTAVWCVSSNNTESVSFFVNDMLMWTSTFLLHGPWFVRKRMAV